MKLYMSQPTKLTPIEQVGTFNTSMVDPQASVESLQQASSPFVKGCTDSDDQRPIPSKIFLSEADNKDADIRRMQIYILSVDSEGFNKNDFNNLLSALSTTLAKDEIDIIMNMSSLDIYRAMDLAAIISGCPGLTIGHASYLDGAGAVLAWLSNKAVEVGFSSLVRVRQFECGGGGEVADVGNSLEFFTKMNLTVFAYFKQVGFLTDEEINSIIKNKRELNLYGPNLFARVDQVNQFKKQSSVQAKPISQNQ